MFTYVLQIFQKTYSKIANFFKQSKFQKYSINLSFGFFFLEIMVNC